MRISVLSVTLYSYVALAAEQDLGARKLRESAVAMRDRLQDQDKQQQTVSEQLQKAEQVEYCPCLCLHCA